MKLYIDTNVILNAIYDRKNAFGADLGYSAAQVFTDAILCKYRLIFSSWMLEELRKHTLPGDIDVLFELAKPKTIKVAHTDADWERARRISSAHPDDALHIVLAKRAEADIIVTNNMVHFKGITNIPLKKPKWLTQDQIP